MFIYDAVIHPGTTRTFSFVLPDDSAAARIPDPLRDRYIIVVDASITLIYDGHAVNTPRFLMASATPDHVESTTPMPPGFTPMSRAEWQARHRATRSQIVEATTIRRSPTVQKIASMF
jgi:hypothetical protein